MQSRLAAYTPAGSPTLSQTDGIVAVVVFSLHVVSMYYRMANKEFAHKKTTGRVHKSICSTARHKEQLYVIRLGNQTQAQKLSSYPSIHSSIFGSALSLQGSQGML